MPVLLHQDPDSVIALVGPAHDSSERQVILGGPRHSYRFHLEGNLGDIYISLIHATELNGANPCDYLVALLRYHAFVEESPARDDGSGIVGRS